MEKERSKHNNKICLSCVKPQILLFTRLPHILSFILNLAQIFIFNLQTSQDLIFMCSFPLFSNYMDKLNKKTKRACVDFDQFHHGVDDGDKAKLKYQTLLKEHFELQKEFVSRKKKLQSAKQKKEAILAEVRFLRRRRKFLSKSQVPNQDIDSNTLQGKRNQSGFEAALDNLDQVVVSNSSVKTLIALQDYKYPLEKNDKAKGNLQVYEEDVRFTEKLNNGLILNKAAGKRKISVRVRDQVTLKV